jgi:transposase-like protein
MGLAKRALAILALDQGEPYAGAARRAGLSEHHVRKWAYRYLEHGLRGLLSQQRPERLPAAPRRQKTHKDTQD